MSDEATEPVPVGVGLEQRALAIRESLRAQGRLGNTVPPVDWTTGEGQGRLDWLLRLAGVPEEYRGAELSRCRLAPDLREYLQDLPGRLARGEGMVLFGPPGTGKSSTASVVVAETLKIGHKGGDVTVRWAYVPDLCDGLLDYRRRAEVQKQQSTADLVVWDDLGVRPLSDFEVGLLDQIVERRYRQKKPMIVATNLTADGMKADGRFDRMRDRWRQRNRVLVIGGASMRKFGT